ncbi:hypothetical protein MMC28_004484 [Mycoblastus sanguinarius]|nr:hypothetical protein [Mycoblastus sanguinarius]
MSGASKIPGFVDLTEADAASTPEEEERGVRHLVQNGAEYLQYLDNADPDSDKDLTSNEVQSLPEKTKFSQEGGTPTSEDTKKKLNERKTNCGKL